jgi:hypothetical protein
MCIDIFNAGAPEKVFALVGDYTSFFKVGKKIRVINAGGNNGKYTVNSLHFTGTYTGISVNETIDHDSDNEGQLKKVSSWRGFS